jgi:hypothetical protein
MIIREIPRKHINALRKMKIMHKTFCVDKEAITYFIPVSRAEGN